MRDWSFCESATFSESYSSHEQSEPVHSEKDLYSLFPPQDFLVFSNTPPVESARSNIAYLVFANSEPVRGFEEGTLQICFADLRQLLDLFMTWDWATYFHDYGQENSKYLRVNPQVAVVLLENISSISHFAAGCDTRKSSP
ncbi:uncharacterized protein LOC143226683 [Tachypleus tridentatus]|uniref:uncharacterized protein LOC143226683 n=1 Tax=Tachypleus tridentatus TaxID=6853 RepID=UPI003FD33B28